jgi:hypothetical protein
VRHRSGAFLQSGHPGGGDLRFSKDRERRAPQQLDGRTLCLATPDQMAATAEHPVWQLVDE